MKPFQLMLPALLCVLLGACASKSTKVQAEKTTGDATVVAAGNVAVVKSRDGSYTGEVSGQVVPGSKFAKLQIGMYQDEVQELMDHAPDRQHMYETGKRWIPFYFGSDARRMQALYKKEGCLIFTAGNVWGFAGGELIRIDHDPSGACYQP
jgi:hypothetical protein